jgi:hypothetical protein
MNISPAEAYYADYKRIRKMSVNDQFEMVRGLPIETI